MILKVLGIGLIGAITAFLLRSFGWKGVPVFISVVFIGLISYSLPYISSLGGLIGRLSSYSDLEGVTGAVMKIVGIGYLTGITADVCRELEASSLASGVALVGRIEIIAVVSPYFEEMIRLGGELLG